MLPIERSRVPAEVLAGFTLAALGIPAVLGYAKIAGMPLVTGLYTMLFPMAVYAVLGSSRHLVVAADSATAVILAAALTGLAAAGSERYVRLAGLAALLTAGMLLAARLARLSFLANFLSRTVLVGFLTGVGIQVAAGQLPDMLGVTAAGRQTLPKLADTVRVLPHVHWADVAVSIAVIVVVVVARWINRRIPGLLIAVIIAIIVSLAADLARHGVAVVGPVPRGLPSLGLPALGWHDAGALLGVAVAMFVVILAQSAATSRAYAAKYEEPFSEATALGGLAAANAAAENRYRTTALDELKIVETLIPRGTIDHDRVRAVAPGPYRDAPGESSLAAACALNKPLHHRRRYLQCFVTPPHNPPRARPRAFEEWLDQACTPLVGRGRRPAEAKTWSKTRHPHDRHSPRAARRLNQGEIQSPMELICASVRAAAPPPPLGGGTRRERQCRATQPDR
jgi:hypothetical protein